MEKLAVSPAIWSVSTIDNRHETPLIWVLAFANRHRADNTETLS